MASPYTALRQLDHRSRLHDRVIVRERMKRLQDEAAVSQVHAYEADGAQRHSAAGVEIVREDVVVLGSAELVLEGPEDVSGHRLELKAHLIGHAAPAFHTVVPLALQPIRQEPPPLGQRM